MEALRKVEGVAAPLLRINIDTDQMIPTIFLGGTDAKGYGAHLFHWWRFLPDGSPNPEFILNQAPYDQAEILLADRNFGCGSSRERAPKALREFGFRAVIAPSFGGIFYNNCWRNGLVPVELPIEDIRRIAEDICVERGAPMVTVDLETLCVRSASGQSFSFSTPDTLREMLLNGVDEVELTLSRLQEIQSFRGADKVRRPWAY